MEKILEIACFNTESAKIAIKAGVHRIELCSNFTEGGLTPSLTDFLEIKSLSNIPVYVMIRPRGGDFCYTPTEFEQMKSEIIEFKKLGANAFVFGILDKNFNLDIDRNKILIDLATPLPCTLHRAFDRIENLENSLENSIDCGFACILTSGKEDNVIEGKENLKTLQKLAKNRIDILCGGGLRSNNIREVAKKTGAIFFHSSAITEGEIANKKEILELLSTL